MRARLTPDGDGFRLNAYKNYVTGGHKARRVPRVVPLPRAASGTKGIGAVVVDLEAPGVTVAGTHVKMGLRATSEAELAFDDVRIEPEDVLLWGDPDNSEVVQDADLAHQPRTLRQRGDVHRRRAGRARVRGRST